MIEPPPAPIAYADSARDCQMALEREFQRLAEQAEGTGWNGDEVAGALLALPTSNIKARIGAAAVAKALKAARESVEEH